MVDTAPLMILAQNFRIYAEDQLAMKSRIQGARRRADLDRAAAIWHAAAADVERLCADIAKVQHHDDIAVERFAAAMKAKLAEKRAQGYGGWDDPARCKVDTLARCLADHLFKGDMVDIGNFAMMLHHRDGGDKAVTNLLTQAMRRAGKRWEPSDVFGDEVPL
jgi:hypothetical protein